jgi:hypothetical protein
MIHENIRLLRLKTQNKIQKKKMKDKPEHTIIKGIILLIGLSIVLFSGCKEPVVEDTREIVAQVSGNTLYWDDVKDFVPENVAKEDSAKIMSGLINKWVMHTLKLQKAEQNLNPEQKDLTKELEEYRSSLLIYKYEQEYIKQNLDTAITNQDIKSYYEGFKPQLLLDKAVVNCAYVILPLQTPDFFNFRSKFRYHYDSKLEEIKEYCQEYAEVYYHPDGNYLYFDELKERLPIQTDNPENYLRYNRFIELKDENFKYLVNILDYKLKSDLAPLNIVKNEILGILLNKRKIELIDKLEESIRNEAMSQNKIEIKK